MTSAATVVTATAEASQENASFRFRLLAADTTVSLLRYKSNRVTSPFDAPEL
jgi:hypothetical protein